MSATKRYIAHWGNGYPPETKVVTQDFFTDNGYDLDDQEAINALGINEVWQGVAPVLQYHIVIRVEDEETFCHHCLKENAAETLIGMAGGFEWCEHCVDHHSDDTGIAPCAECGDVAARLAEHPERAWP